MSKKIDRKQLEQAAKAAKIKVDWRKAVACLCYSDSPYHIAWNPLDNDSDALRLAAALNFDVCVNICFCEVVWVDMVKSETHSETEDWGAGDVELSDRMEYIRRAIVRMAAKVADLRA